MSDLLLDLKPQISELEVGDAWHFSEGAQIDNCDIQVRVSEKPLYFNYYKLCKIKDAVLTKEHQELYRRFDLWLLKFNVGIIDRSSRCNIVEIGLKISFHRDYKIQILEMMPQTKFIKPIVSGGFAFDADISLNGEANVPEVGNGMPAITSIDGQFKITSKADLGLRVGFPTLSPIIQATGQFDNFGQWSIKRQVEPLVGDQILTIIILTEKGLPSIEYKAQVFCTIQKYLLFHSRRESDWVTTKFDLL